MSVEFIKDCDLQIKSMNKEYVQKKQDEVGNGATLSKSQIKKLKKQKSK